VGRVKEGESNKGKANNVKFRFPLWCLPLKFLLADAGGPFSPHPSPPQSHPAVTTPVSTRKQLPAHYAQWWCVLRNATN